MLILLLSLSDSFSIPSSGMELICRTEGPLLCGQKLEPGRCQDLLLFMVSSGQQLDV